MCLVSESFTTKRLVLTSFRGTLNISESDSNWFLLLKRGQCSSVSVLHTGLPLKTLGQISYRGPLPRPLIMWSTIPLSFSLLSPSLGRLVFNGTTSVSTSWGRTSHICTCEDPSYHRYRIKKPTHHKLGIRIMSPQKEIYI